MWDLKKGECIKSIDEHTSWITAIKISKEHFASASNDGMIKIFVTETLTCSISLKSCQKAVKCIKFFQVDKLLSGYSDGSCVLWCIQTGSCIYTFYGHIAPITSIKIWSNFEFLSACDNGSIKVFDINKLQCTKTLRKSQSCVRNKCLLMLLNKNC